MKYCKIISILWWWCTGSDIAVRAAAGGERAARGPLRGGGRARRLPGAVRAARLRTQYRRRPARQ